MRLFIAEKPSVARAIAQELGVTQRENGYLHCGADTVTWCFGHMLEPVEPDYYLGDDVPRHPQGGNKIWRTQELPIIPQQWIMQPCADAKEQLAIISRLLNKATHVIHAGDPDREGQLLVDAMLEYFQCRLPVQRFWVSAQDAVSIQRGLSTLQDNKTYRGFGAAAQARSRADWLIGMNLSRAYTLRAQRGGSQVVLTVGRVQSPTLTLVVNRDRAIEAFQPVAYHTISAAFKYQDQLFVGRWQPQDGQAGLDDQGRLVDATVAQDLVDAVKGQSGHVVDYQQQPQHQRQPLPYALSDMTVWASSQFGYSASEVLEICQALYATHKLISYPRTDCAYLPESQHADAPQVLAAIKHVYPELAELIDGADPTIKSATWNDQNITAHHGLIPTMHKGSMTTLSDAERHIYERTVRAYLAQFYPPYAYQTTSVTLEVAGDRFMARGQVVTHPGWRAVYGQSSPERAVEDDDQPLPTITMGDEVNCLQATIHNRQTQPQPRFTEGTLIRAMENIHQAVTDPEHKKLLRDGDGLGTSATRAAIISELKRHGFLEVRGKHIISTTLGRSVVDALPEVVRSPVLTALYERLLLAIEQGAWTTESDATHAVNEFVKKQEAFIREHVAQANEGSVTLKGAPKMPDISTVHHCRACGQGLIRRTGKKPGTMFWSCSGYPRCLQQYPDLKGQPQF